MIDAALKRLVYQRAQAVCEYCRSQAAFSPDPFAVEHIIPRARGGTDESDNLAFSCQGCNNHKYTGIEALDPLTGKSAPLYHPRRDDWKMHFAWSDDLTRIIGLTPIGRATIEKLQLNREGVVNLRQVMVMAGKHPPVA